MDFSRNCQTKPPEFVVRPHELEPNLGFFFPGMTFLNWRFRKFQVLQGFGEIMRTTKLPERFQGAIFCRILNLRVRKLQLMRESLTDFFSFRFFGIDLKTHPSALKIKAWKSKKKRYFCVNVFPFPCGPFCRFQP